MYETIRIYFISLIGFLLVFSAGCVSLKTEDEFYAKKSPQQARVGIYHKVKKGETLWRIAKTYDAAVNDIARANNILKAARIEENQLVFIPGAKVIRDIALEIDNNRSGFAWPLKGKVIKHFHERYDNQINKGIDIRAKVGDHVKASRTGRVVFADYLTGYGHTVILDHSDGFYTVYAKNSKLFVTLGELVLKHSKIAQVGHNRNLAYLHFEIRKKSMESNPLYYLP